jgi:predicted RNA polymerase sigma factor
MQPIPLLEQDRARRDQLLIGRGLAALERGRKHGALPGPCALQAELPRVTREPKRPAQGRFNLA